MNFLNVVGARPNYMKIAPFQRELEDRGYEFTLVHTGQHYDKNLSEQFFNDLGMKAPDYNLGVGSDTQARQTAKVMEEIEPVIDQEEPDWVVVVGDVNSTLAASLVTAKKEPKLAHIEGGIRSGNWDMPEEVNRVVVDRLSDAIFCFDEEALNNLSSEGIEENKVFLTGDIMIDSLHYALRERNGEVLEEYEIPENYGVLTLHRPSNVDDRDSLDKAFKRLEPVTQEFPLIFPIHPRTEKNLKEHGVFNEWSDTFHLLEPLNYSQFIELMSEAEVVLTDSGSIQQETTVMEVPCITLREETERGITVRRGTNRLVGWSEDKINQSIQTIKNNEWKESDEIELWDGNTAKRILDILEEI